MICKLGQKVGHQRS